MGAHFSVDRRVASTQSLVSSSSGPSQNVRGGQQSSSTSLLHRIPSLRYLKKRRGSVSAENGRPKGPATLLLEEPAKSDAVVARLSDIVKDIAFFKELQPEQRQLLINSMIERCVKAGEVIISEGEEGDYFYVVEQGTFIARKGEDVMFVYDGSGSFGELALLYNAPRAATITASTDGILWGLDRSTFRTLVVGSTHERRKTNESVLLCTPLFANLTEQQRAATADSLAQEIYTKGTIIIQQGEPITSSSKFYIVVEGNVECFRTGILGDRHKTRSIGRGGVFGEYALLTKGPRQADCLAATDVKCLTMARDAFERLMGPVEATLATHMEAYKKMNQEERRRTGP